MDTAWYRLRGRNVTVRIDATRSLWCSSKLHRLIKMTVTYRSGFFEALLLEILSTSRLAHHGFRVSSCWDNHCGIGTPSSDTAIMHDILRVIFTSIYDFKL